MVALSPVTTPTINLGQSREQFPAREETASKERLSSTKPSGTATAKSENSDQKNFRDQSNVFKSADARLPDQSTMPGNRRGSLLDLSV